jgi:hypothetical protein
MLKFERDLREQLEEPHDKHWKASPATRMTELLHAGCGWSGQSTVLRPDGFPA